MRDLPKLVVTRKQADRVLEWRGPGGRHTVPVPERPTMPCPACLGHGQRWRNGRPGPGACGTGTAPIPEGTRVEVGWRGIDLNDPYTRIDPDWHPVATATLSKVEDQSCINPGHDCCGYCPTSFYVVLTNVEAAP